MPYVPGATITTYITLVDIDGVPITGATFSLTTIGPTGTEFPVTQVEIGGGIYRLQFQVTEAGSWFVKAVFAGPPPQTFQESWDVDVAASQGSGVAISGLLSQTRRQLRRRIADRLGDLLIFTASAPSLSNTSFIDTLMISSTADNLTGRMLSVATGVNAGHVALIQSYDISTGTITFNPPAPSIFGAGDEVEVVNERSRGWQIPEYNRAINAAINDAFPQALAEFAYDVPVEFDQGNPFITAPANMSHAYDVAWRRESDDAWMPLRKGKWYGWKADPTAGLIQVTGYPGVIADGMTLRIRGYGRHPDLSSDDDATVLNAEWIVAAACYRLAMSGADRDPSGIRGQMILTFQREADQYRPRIRTTPKPGTTRVRVI